MVGTHATLLVFFLKQENERGSQRNANVHGHRGTEPQRCALRVVSGSGRGDSEQQPGDPHPPCIAVGYSASLASRRGRGVAGPAVASHHRRCREARRGASDL